MNKRTNDAPLVYSSDLGRMCPGCGKAVASCSCAKQQARAAGDGIVRVRRECKGRGGKTVCTISGVPGKDEALRALCTGLKKRLGTGGAVKEGVIEIQGDHCEALLAELARLGFKAKKAGG